MLNTVLLSITERCNYNCKHCRVVSFSSEIDFDKACKIVEKIKGKAKIVNITGGEPLLYPEILPLVRYIKTKTSLKVSISTNAHFLDKNLAEKLKKAGLDGINISLDSIYPSKHDSFRGRKGAFKIAEKGIKTAVKTGLNCRIASAIGKFNYKEVSELAIKAVDLGCSAISFRRILPVSKGKSLKSEFLNKRELAHVFKDVYKMLFFFYPLFNLYIQEPLDLFFAQKLLRKKFSSFGGCGACRSLIEIKTNGDVWPCPILPIRIGNIYENSLTEILNHSLSKSFIKRDLKGVCKTCDLKQICGGCRAWALYKTGDILESDPLCLKDNYEKIIGDLPSFKEKKILKKEEIEEIISLTTKFMRPVFKKSNMVWNSKILEKDLLKNKDPLWLLKYNSKVIGYLWFAIKGNTVYLKAIIINSSWQKKKIGFLLIKRLELFSKNKGKKQICFAIQKGNRNSLNFFKKLGYKKIEEDKNKGFMFSKDI